jgi:hypothetical protein
VSSSGGESLAEQAVAQPAVADRKRFFAQLFHDRPNDACAGQDDVGTFGLEPDDRPASHYRARENVLHTSAEMLDWLDRTIGPKRAAN